MKRKMGISNVLCQKHEKMGIHIFCTQNNKKKNGNSHVFFTLATKKKCSVFLEFPMKKVGKIFVIPMFSSGGVHLISGIAHYLPAKTF